MVGSLSLQNSAGVDVPILLRPKRRITGASGLIGIPSIRKVVRARPNRHGAIDESKYAAERGPSITGLIIASTEAEVWDEYDALCGVFWQAITEPRLLKWTRQGSGLALQAAVKLAGEPMEAPLEATNGVRLPYQVQFLAEDPRVYSQALTTQSSTALTAAAGGKTYPRTYPRTFTPSGGGEVTVSNAGKVETPPVFRIYGTCTDPQILNTVTGERIVIEGTVTAPDYLELDVFGRSVRLNGTSNRYNLLDAELTDWFELDPGSTPLRLLASSFDASARLDVLYRAAYA